MGSIARWPIVSFALCTWATNRTSMSVWRILSRKWHGCPSSLATLTIGVVSNTRHPADDDWVGMPGPGHWKRPSDLLRENSMLDHVPSASAPFVERGRADPTDPFPGLPHGSSPWAEGPRGRLFRGCHGGLGRTADGVDRHN